MNTSRSLVLGLVCLTTGLAGCGSGSAGGRGEGAPAPMATLADAQASSKARRDAIAALQADIESGAVSRDEGRAALKRIAWSWHQGTPPEVRIAAIDALISDSASLDDTRTMLTLMLPTEQQREVLEHVCAVAVEQQWTSMTPALVRSWTREVPGWDDLKRPEAAAIKALWPDREQTEVLFDVFAGSGDADEKARPAAWALLTRLDASGERTRALVERDAAALEASGDSLAGAIARAWRELQVVPTTTEQLEWTARIFQSPSTAESFAQAVRALPEGCAEGLALRHLPVLAWVSTARSEWMTLSREALLTRTRELLDDARPMGPMAKPADRELSGLSWLDLLVTLTAIEALADPAAVAELFVQADDDQLDRSTEHGGILDAEASGSGGWSATAYLPRPTERFGDRQFVASDDMIRGGDTAPFHYHFHAQKHANREYAVPSGGDMETARRLGRSSLVLTFTEVNRMNADLYFPSGLILDLGLIERPGQ